MLRETSPRRGSFPAGPLQPAPAFSSLSLTNRCYSRSLLNDERSEFTCTRKFIRVSNPARNAPDQRSAYRLYPIATRGNSDEEVRECLLIYREQLRVRSAFFPDDRVRNPPDDSPPFLQRRAHLPSLEERHEQSDSIEEHIAGLTQPRELSLSPLGEVFGSTERGILLEISRRN